MIITILGRGPWGNALASLLRINNHTVSFLGRKEEGHDQEILILALPTQAIHEALSYIHFPEKTPIVINTSKGIDQRTHRFPYDLAKERFGNTLEYYTLMGPSFATEVSQQMPTLVNLGYTKTTTRNEQIRELFLTKFFRVQLTKGVEALELAGAFKNIYAIGCGIASGLGYGSNTRTKFMVLAIDELQRLYDGLGYTLDKHATAGTIGDIILTCSGTESRNFRFGKLLTKHSVQASLAEVNSTVEGYHSLASVAYLEKKAQTNLPLAQFIGEVIRADNPKSIKHTFDQFIQTI